MNSAVPEGYRHDPHGPDLFVLRCPDCEHEERRQRRSGKMDRTCVTCGRLMGVTPVSKAPAKTPGEGEQHAMTDGGQDPEDGPDPERLPDTYTPAIVQLSGSGVGDTFVADYEILSSDWVRVTEWSGERTKFPPRRVMEIREVRTEYVGEPSPDTVPRPKRVVKDAQRQQARQNQTRGTAIADD
ncbi:hypothetical protein [Halosimplex sp. J119]